jgi:adenine phosphoribosyltransferase
MHLDAVPAGARVLLADDLIATGGTAEAAIRLLQGAGARIVECCFLVELPDLGGRARLEGLGQSVHALVSFAGD